MINARPQLRDTFEFSEISPNYFFNIGGNNSLLHAGKVGYLTDQTKGDPIVEFVGLVPKMYSFIMCDASKPIPVLNYPIHVRHKALATGVARSQIKLFKHDDYVRMFNGGAENNLVNRRIGF